jgi:peptidoglycan/LPS O-acetylase OafA/YrhL
MRSPNSSYIPAVDHVRAFAAVIVLVHHSFLFIGARLAKAPDEAAYFPKAVTPVDAFVTEGHTGVALFMVLSGFIFTYIAYGKRIEYGRFVLNRILRIYPLMIGIYLVAWAVRPALAGAAGFFATLAIPFQLIGPVDWWFIPSIYPFTNLFWTIAPEFQFYLLFPLILSFVTRKGAAMLGVLILGAFCVRALLAINGADVQTFAYFTIFGRIDQFLIGMGAAILYRTYPDRGYAWLCPLALVVMGALLFGYSEQGGASVGANWKLVWPTLEGTVWAGFILGYLDFAGRLPSWTATLFARVGQISFSIYLLHTAIIAVVLKVGPVQFGFGANGDAVINALVFVLPGCLAVSWVTFRLIEQPFLRLRVRYLNDWPVPAAHSPIATPAFSNESGRP